jgi:hypothetical protein
LEEHDQALMEALQIMNPLGVVLVSVFVKEINKKSSKIRRSLVDIGISFTCDIDIGISFTCDGSIYNNNNLNLDYKDQSKL